MRAFGCDWCPWLMSSGLVRLALVVELADPDGRSRIEALDPRGVGQDQRLELVDLKMGNERSIAAASVRPCADHVLLPDLTEGVLLAPCGQLPRGEPLELKRHRDNGRP